ncbi:MAG: hypothetical protein ACYTGV_00830 [Planctomycetota bacterium]
MVRGGRALLCLRGLALLVLTACGEQGSERLEVMSGRDTDAQGLVIGRRGDGSIRFVRRIDGSVATHQRARVTADEDQYLLVTGKEPGVDQCKILVLNLDGKIATEYRVSGVTPFQRNPATARYEGEPFRQLQAAVPDTVSPLRWRGRRLVTFCTYDTYYPASLVVLEAASRDRFEERLVFWNVGHIHYLVVEPPYLVALGMSNLFRTEGIVGYALFAAVFHLDDLPERDADDSCARDTSPGRNHPEVLETAAYRFYVCTPHDTPTSWASGEVRDGVLTASEVNGRTCVIDLRTGSVELGAEKAYHRDYARRRQADGSLPEYEEHLEARRRAVRVWSRKP